MEYTKIKLYCYIYIYIFPSYVSISQMPLKPETKTEKVQNFMNALTEIQLLQPVEEFTNEFMDSEILEREDLTEQFQNKIIQVLKKVSVQQALEEMFEKLLEVEIDEQKEDDKSPQESIQGKENNSSSISKTSGNIERIISRITDSVDHSINQIRQAFNRVSIEENQDEQMEGQSQFVEFNKNNAVEEFESNEFMGEQFGFNQKLSEVKDYCAELKDKTVDLYMKEAERQKEEKEQKINQVFSILEEYYLHNQSHAFLKIKKFEKEEKSDYENILTNKTLSNLNKKASSSHSNRIKSAESKKNSHEQFFDEFNLELTTKTRNSKNLFQASKQDSLLYSAASDFAPHQKSKDISPEKYAQSSKSVLKKIDDEYEEDPSSMIELQKSESKSCKSQKPESEKNQVFQKKQENFSLIQRQKDQKQYIQEEIIPLIQEKKRQNNKQEEQFEDEEKVAQSEIFSKPEKNYQKKRVETEVPVKKDSKYFRNQAKKINKIDFSKYGQVSSQYSNQNIFTTQISSYQNKILRLKQAKQIKKRKLEQQLQKVNHQIKILKQKEEQINSPNKNANYVSRVQISNDLEAKKKAQSLVKNLRSQKRYRNIAKISEFQSLDKNINEYMEQLTKIRQENQQKMKQKKKIEILQRMKKNQLRKMNEKKKIEATSEFVHKLKLGGVEPRCSKDTEKSLKIQVQENILTESRESPSMTPELSQKKMYLNKIRSFSVKKQNKDIYEQALS